MARNPRDLLDEEEIIRHRDDVPDVASDEPLSTEARRALADSRLRALAFALGAEQAAHAGAEEVADPELLAYLLESLPKERRVQLEVLLRGDAQAFGRLMTLHSALHSKADTRDRT
jgi:hypothetical protein